MGVIAWIVLGIIVGAVVLLGAMHLMEDGRRSLRR